MTRLRSAELVFIEAPRGGAWAGRFVNQAAVVDRLDASNGPGRVRFVARIVDHSEELERRRVARGSWGAEVGVATTHFPFEVTTQGAHPSARRYSSHRTLADAQAYLARWARRRFAYAPEV